MVGTLPGIVKEKLEGFTRNLPPGRALKRRGEKMRETEMPILQMGITFLAAEVG